MPAASLRWLLLPVPFVVPPLLHWAYEPINRHWTVEKFGCGCPPMTGGWRFNANYVNLVLWFAVLVGLSVLVDRLVPHASGRRRFNWLVPALALLVVLCAHYYGRGVWL